MDSNPNYRVSRGISHQSSRMSLVVFFFVLFLLFVEFKINYVTFGIYTENRFHPYNNNNGTGFNQRNSNYSNNYSNSNQHRNGGNYRNNSYNNNNGYNNNGYNNNGYNRYNRYNNNNNNNNNNYNNRNSGRAVMDRLGIRYSEQPSDDLCDAMSSLLLQLADEPRKFEPIKHYLVSNADGKLNHVMYFLKLIV